MKMKHPTKGFRDIDQFIQYLYTLSYSDLDKYIEVLKEQSAHASWKIFGDTTLKLMLRMALKRRGDIPNMFLDITPEINPIDSDPQMSLFSRA